MDAETRLEEFRQLAHAMHGPMYDWPEHISLEHARLAQAADDERYGPAPYTCRLCGQRIDDGKPCGCGARY
jgi:hypothetical protein